MPQPATYHQIPRTRAPFPASLTILALLTLASCALPTFTTRASATATPAATPQPTPTATLAPSEIQQQRAQAIAAYMALFKHGIPGLLRDIPLGEGIAQKAQIGQSFKAPCYKPPVVTQRDVVPLYAYVTIVGGQPMMHLTLGTLKSGKPTTFVWIANYSKTLFYLTGGPLGGEFNGSVCYGGQPAECAIGFCRGAAPVVMANAYAKLINLLGASMVKDAANPIMDPTSPGNKIAGFISLPQDIPDAWGSGRWRGYTFLDLPYTDVCSFEGYNLVCPHD